MNRSSFLAACLLSFLLLVSVEMLGVEASRMKIKAGVGAKQENDVGVQLVSLSLSSIHPVPCSSHIPISFDGYFAAAPFDFVSRLISIPTSNFRLCML